VGLDLPRGGERGLELRAHPPTGADFLAEDLVLGDVVRGERVQLRLAFLSEAGAPGVPASGVVSAGRAAAPSGSSVRGLPDADVRGRGVRSIGAGTGAGPPRLPRAAVGHGSGTHAEDVWRVTWLGVRLMIICHV
jgi:hypothetical protein